MRNGYHLIILPLILLFLIIGLFFTISYLNNQSPKKNTDSLQFIKILSNDSANQANNSIDNNKELLKQKFITHIQKLLDVDKSGYISDFKESFFDFDYGNEIYKKDLLEVLTDLKRSDKDFDYYFNENDIIIWNYQDISKTGNINLEGFNIQPGDYVVGVKPRQGVDAEGVFVVYRYLDNNWLIVASSH